MDVTLELVRLISQMIKGRDFVAKPEVLDTLLSIRLTEGIYEINIYDDRKKKEKEKQTKAKKSKHEVQLEKDLQVSDARLSTEERTKFVIRLMLFLFYLFLFSKRRLSRLFF